LTAGQIVEGAGGFPLLFFLFLSDTNKTLERFRATLTTNLWPASVSRQIASSERLPNKNPALDQ
jgi:hypothetical protein